MSTPTAPFGARFLLLSLLPLGCGEPGEVVRAPSEEISPFAESELPDLEWAASAAGLEFLEAAFRFQLANNTASPDVVDRADFVFLGLRGPDGIEDPPDELMSRFEGLPDVEPASRADLEQFRGVRHRDLPGRGAAFVVEGLRRVDDATIEACITYRGGCMSESTYRFERRDGVWIQVSGGLRWIS